jgi:lipoyl synthase
MPQYRSGSGRRRRAVLARGWSWWSGECWGGAKGTATATIMLMGDTCTRGCRFCAVKTAKAPAPVDPNESAKVAQAIHKWGRLATMHRRRRRRRFTGSSALVQGSITSYWRRWIATICLIRFVMKRRISAAICVGWCRCGGCSRSLRWCCVQGAAHIASCVRALKEPGALPLFVEVLTPDFSGRAELVDLVATSGLDVFAHNIETVESCSPFVRDHRANYKQSLAVLRQAKISVPKLISKSSIMVGVGETLDEVEWFGKSPH